MRELTRKDLLDRSCDECFFAECDVYDCLIPERSKFINEDMRETNDSRYDYLPCKYRILHEEAIEIVANKLDAEGMVKDERIDA